MQLEEGLGGLVLSSQADLTLLETSNSERVVKKLVARDFHQERI